MRSTPLHAHDLALSRPSGALAAPTFWVSLCVLVLNDHVLKGSGWCPSWLTGKLSDFAGLIVAPVVAAELCRGRLAPLRLLAACAVVCTFAGTELSSRGAALVEQGMGAIGIGMRLWPDPTDLVALAVLPWTFHLLRKPAVPAQPALWQRIGLALAALTCIATSPIDDHALAAFLVNHSGDTVTVRVRWFERPEACSVAMSGLDDLLASTAPSAERSIALTRGQTVRLDIPSDPTTEENGCFGPWFDPRDAGAVSCVLLHVAADELPAHWVRADEFWLAPRGSKCRAHIPAYDHPGDGAVVLGRRSDSARSLSALGPVEVLAAAR